MINVAMDDIREYGLYVNLEHLNFEDLIRDAGVSRSAAYRRWASKEMFFNDLLLQLSASELPGGHAFTQQTIKLVVSRALDQLDLLETAEGRRQVFFELCREGVEANFYGVYQSPDWQTYVAVAAIMTSIDDGDLQTEAQQRLWETEQRYLQDMTSFYEMLGSILGFSPRPGISYETLTVLGGSIVDGLALEGTILPRQIPDEKITADPFNTGHIRQWSVPALGYASMLSGLLDFDDEHEVDKTEVRAILEALIS